MKINVNSRSMNFSESQSLSHKQKEEIIYLWNKEYPLCLAYSKVTEFDDYLESLSAKYHIILSDHQDVIRGWLVCFTRNGERWFAMILDADLQGQGWGSKMLKLAKEKNKELNGWVIDNDRLVKQDGSNYRSPIPFYEKNEFKILSDIRLKNKKIDGIKVQWANGKELFPR